MTRILFAFFTLSISFSLNAQNLYWPRDLKKAYKNQTRSNDGYPGKKYWQNTGTYNITVTAMPPDRTIKGTEQIAYINNSQDTPRVLVFKFIQNIHKPGVTRLGQASTDYLTDGVHVDAYTENGIAKNWGQKNSGTIQFIRLSKPLMPHDSVQLTFDWHYQISLKSGREGMIDSTTYYLAYFYPRVAVFDDVNGWDDIEHNEALEFYNDFNNYILHVKVPKNYLVWATGNLQNAKEVLQPKYAERLNESMKAANTIHIADAADIAAQNITAQNSVNTWTFAYNNITDVALGLSDHYVWDASSVLVDKKANRRASIQAAYNDTAKDFHHVVEFGQRALSFLSTQWPGVAYPFPKMTVFQGYAGMEYPMMANDETYNDFNFSRFVEEHEISHTYFPFYMGINETRYGFMDEGWATTFELLYNRSVMSKDSADDFYKQFRVNGWIGDDNADEDLPIITPGENLSGRGLGNNEYGKPSLAYLAIKDLLGDEMFKKCLHGFMERWHGKHPLPWDFFYAFNNVSGQNLNWFWNAWFFGNNYIDLAVNSVHPINSGYQLTIENIGGFPVPIDIQLNFKDGSTQVIHKSPVIWAGNQKQVMIDITVKKALQSIQLVTDIFVDADESNNFLENK
ncbi:M1 family metallopeptidase [Ginsengibacter hankyongi]|uniref:M1 family metallopeptidase n=1 Tax=Ginsengibacter hankyongi TaxID=2607284 RepID=A0A5J5IBI1_9BACT|nr:M1 family metallopeptidase [Ginsengibacter hankyongi]KAA9034525.1 M1 family metallopeptidase [Ginsengibacter hankyongi]